QYAVRVQLDPRELASRGIGLTQVKTAIQQGNVDLPTGSLSDAYKNYTIQANGQLTDAAGYRQLIVTYKNGAPVRLQDLGQVIDSEQNVKVSNLYSDRKVTNRHSVVLAVQPQPGANTVNIVDAIQKLLPTLREQVPKSIEMGIMYDRSQTIRASVNDVKFTLVLSVCLVILVIFLFLRDITATLIPSLALPVAIIGTFAVMYLSGFSLDNISLMALTLSVGFVVDDAIVVIENTHRIFVQGQGRLTSKIAARMAAGEVFVPVLAGTVTTLAPFFPLLFWPGIIGKFMIYLPTMLIFTLSASLVVAFIMNPVFAVDFMNHPEGETKPAKSAIFKSPVFLVMLGVGILLDIFGFYFGGNLLILFALLMVLNTYVFDSLIHKFQNNALPWIMGHYEDLLRWALAGWKPVYLLLGTVGLFIVSILFFRARKVPVVFFPKSDPNFVYVYLKLPVGTNVDYTDSVTRQLEKRVDHVLGIENSKTNPIVESVISNVAIGASDPASGDRSTRPELGRVQVSL
ncbi:efflux RND transporter permease subunit, partial [Nostoc sp. 'Peltigera malacea cyanobiont' DB3992]|uniref:efflux RND transporter permease subunit n=1 Tax=Nostoc sp. 'Peltigera malacea cyanobiont' DB3992 TaxID=1206980 RepID=UPI00211EE3BE